MNSVPQNHLTGNAHQLGTFKPEIQSPRRDRRVKPVPSAGRTGVFHPVSTESVGERTPVLPATDSQNQYLEHKAQHSDRCVFSLNQCRIVSPKSDRDSSLGIIGKFASDGEENTDDALQDNRYRLQNFAADLLPGESVCTCQRTIIPTEDHVVINQSIESGKAYYSNLRTCNSVWMCPFCAGRITEERRRELSVAVAQAQKMDLHVSMISVTMRHSLRDRLADLVEVMKKAWRALFAGEWGGQFKAEYGWRGTVAAFEITHGEESGWHPHMHILLFSEYEIDGAILHGFQKALAERWQRTLNRFGRSASLERGIHVKNAHSAIADYIAKYGKEPGESGWSVEHEIAKSPAKNANREGRTPFQLLTAYAAGDKQAGALFREYALAMKTKQQLRWSPGLKKLLDVVAALAALDAGEAAADMGSILVAVIERIEWKAVCVLKLRQDLLTAAETAGLDGVLDLLDHHHIRRRLPNKIEEMLISGPPGALSDNDLPMQTVLPLGGSLDEIGCKPAVRVDEISAGRLPNGHTSQIGLANPDGLPYLAALTD